MKYRGRIAPTPTGYLHLGHARTFWIAQARCQAAGGTLLYRNEDLDPNRCKPEFRATTLEDLRWLGVEPDEMVDRCLDLAGPIEVGEQTHSALVKYANTVGPISLDTDEARDENAGNVARMLQLIVASREYQFA